MMYKVLYGQGLWRRVDLVARKGSDCASCVVCPFEYDLLMCQVDTGQLITVCAKRVRPYMEVVKVVGDVL